MTLFYRTDPARRRRRRPRREGGAGAARWPRPAAVLGRGGEDAAERLGMATAGRSPAAFTDGDSPLTVA